MKRSDMLRKIRYMLDGTIFLHDKYEEQILEVVEKLGMQPPKSRIIKQLNPQVEFNEWEPEDE